MDDKLSQYFKMALDEGSNPLEEAALIPQIRDAEKARYELKGNLAEGGMKKLKVYFDSLTSRTVARAEIKEISDADLVDRFIREAHLTAELEHPNIISIYDLGLNESGEPFFTMKLLGGENLREVLNALNEGKAEYKARYSRAALLEIFLKVCDAVAYAHSKEIIHLDLKPSNIHINEYGEVLVCDWGLAQKLSQKDSVIPKVKKGFLAGSPGFMSPEQIDSSRADLSMRSDIYSLGAILYALLSYKGPFDSLATEDILEKTLEGKIPSPSSQNTNQQLPKALCAIVSKAMSLKSEGRYSSVKQLSSDLRAYAGGFATQAEAAGFFRQLILLGRRHRSLSIVLMATITVVAVLSTYFINELNQKNVQAQALIQALNEEKNQSERVKHSAAENLFELAKAAYQNRHVTRASRLLNDVLALKPQYEEARIYRGFLLVGRLDLQSALTELNALQRKFNLEALVEILEKYKTDKHLTWQQVVELRQEVIALKTLRFKIIAQHLTQNFCRKTPLKDHLAFAKEVLQRSSKGRGFKFNWAKVDDGYRLSLRGSPAIEDIAVLAYLPITELDVSNTKVTDIAPLKDMELRSLNLSNTRVSDLKVLKNMPLQELYLAGSHVGSVSDIPKSLTSLSVSSSLSNIRILEKYQKLEELTIPAGVYPENLLRALRDKLELIEK